MKAALIAGATGLVGGKLLCLLLSNNQYQKVISIGRRKINIEHPKLEQYIVDFEHLDNLDLYAEVVFCCLGTTIKKAGSKEAFTKVDLEYPKNLAHYSLKIGANSFHLISSMGADTNSGIFYNRTKGQIEEEISSKLFERVHLYRPSLLLGARDEKRVMEGIGQVLMKGAGFLFVGFLKNYKAIQADSVADFMLQTSLSKTEGIFIHLSGKMH